MLLSDIKEVEGLGSECNHSPLTVSTLRMIVAVLQLPQSILRIHTII